MKRDYNNTIPITQPYQTKREDQYHVRDHATNIGIAYFLITFSVMVSILAILSATAIFTIKWPQDYLIALPISLTAGIVSFALALNDFTKDARAMLWTQYEQQKEIIAQQIIKEQGDNEYQKTFLPAKRGNDKVGIDVYLSESQLAKIAQAALNSGKLTINYLDSIGISRPRAEKLRQELAKIGYAKFNQHSELIFTKDGLQCFKRL